MKKRKHKNKEQKQILNTTRTTRTRTTNNNIIEQKQTSKQRNRHERMRAESRPHGQNLNEQKAAKVTSNNGASHHPFISPLPVTITRSCTTHHVCTYPQTPPDITS